MRTQEHIVERIGQIKEMDWLGTQQGDLAIYLDTNRVKEFCKADADLSDWKQEEITREGVIKKILEYLDFAFEKAIDHRGISASRSIKHMQAWLWLLEDNELLDFAETNSNYRNYGVPILKTIATKYDKPMPNEILNWENGKKCELGCNAGCGS